MSVKKLLVLNAAGLAAIGAVAAMAGGPDHMAMPAEPTFQHSVYLDGHVGYTQSNWRDFNSNNVMGINSGTAGTTTFALFSPYSNGNGGFTGGVDLGYTITRHIAVESGWFHVPEVKGRATSYATQNSYASAGNTATVNSWFAYTAAKLSVPVMDNMDLFGKVGVAYRALTYRVPAATRALAVPVGNGHYWAPVFATGLQYNWEDWQLGAQFLHLPGNAEVNYANTSYGAPNAAPEINMYTGFVGYKFDV